MEFKWVHHGSVSKKTEVNNSWFIYFCFFIHFNIHVHIQIDFFFFMHLFIKFFIILQFECLCCLLAKKQCRCNYYLTNKRSNIFSFLHFPDTGSSFSFVFVLLESRLCFCVLISFWYSLIWYFLNFNLLKTNSRIWHSAPKQLSFSLSSFIFGTVTQFIHYFLEIFVDSSIFWFPIWIQTISGFFSIVFITCWTYLGPGS